jgi:hypothetical protein
MLMSGRVIAVVLAISVIVISALVVVGLVNRKPRLVEMRGCANYPAVFVNPEEVAAVLEATSGSYRTVVWLRGNAQPIPACEDASAVAEKLGRVRRLDH